MSILSTVSGRPSGPPALGADELLESFVAHTSRREHDVAADLKRMVGVEPTPPPKEAEPSAAGAAKRPTDDRGDAGTADAAATELLASTPPPGVAPAQAFSVRPPPSRVPYLLITFVVAAAAGGFALWKLGLVAGPPPVHLEPVRSPPRPPPPPQPAPPPAPCRARILVDDVPAGTDVLIKSGVSPVDVRHVPTGAKIEMLALKDGLAPVRAAVPASAAWSVASGTPRVDLTIDLQRRLADAGVDRGADAGHAASHAAGQTGTVHVVTAPPGAEVWMLVGRGPNARVDDLACGTPVDLLLVGLTDAGRPHRGRLRVEAGQFTSDASGTPTARASARQAVAQ
jgi:hypothetical protein